VEKAAKELNYDFSGVDAAKNSKDLYGLRYSDFVVPLVKAVQELSKQNDELKQRIEKLEAATTAQTESANTTSQGVTISTASLEQNTPNPFKNVTIINYTLPQQYASAKVMITDKSGKIIKEINVTGTGKGSVQVDASTLASGAYQYSLLINGKLIGTKQMVLAR
jgi:flagellar hook assembly protein FlgD